jgi:hypothetical protein
MQAPPVNCWINVDQYGESIDAVEHDGNGLEINGLL